MKNTIKILSLLCVIAAFASCKEDKLLTYDSETSIFFRQKKWVATSNAYTVSMTYDGKTMSVSTKANINEVIDSVEVSMAFVDEVLRSDTTFLPVSIMGDISPERRDINFEIINSGDDRQAVEGVDFRILDAYIPAGRKDGGIVIEMMRDNLTEDESKIIDFRLLPNEYFETDYKWINRSTTDTTKVSTLTMRLAFTDGLKKPSSWPTSFLGEWSTKKAYLLVYELGMSWEFMYDSQPDRLIAAAYGNALAKWLLQYKEDHDGTPYYEADGETEMKAGSSASA